MSRNGKRFSDEFKNQIYKLYNSFQSQYVKNTIGYILNYGTIEIGFIVL